MKMDIALIVALILGGAQVIGSIIVLISTIISNRNNRLTKEIEKKDKQIVRYAKQLYFLRFVEESVYAELAQTNANCHQDTVKKRIHSAISDKIGIRYNSMDNDILQRIDDSQNIKPIDISSYRNGY